MEHGSVALLRIDGYDSEVLIGLDVVADFYVYGREVGIDRDVASMTDHDDFVESVLSENSADSSFEYGAGFRAGG